MLMFQVCSNHRLGMGSIRYNISQKKLGGGQVVFENTSTLHLIGSFPPSIFWLSPSHFLQSENGWGASKTFQPASPCLASTLSWGHHSILNATCIKWFPELGKPVPSKTDEFSEKFRTGRGWGVISNPKIYVADFCHYKGYFGHEFWKKSATWFSENEGGGQQHVWNFSENSSIFEGTGFP